MSTNQNTNQKPETVSAAKSDPMIRAMRKAYRGSKRCEWDNLLAEESRWKRKATIAQNKLADVRNRMNEFAEKLVTEATTGGTEAKVETP